METTPTEEGHVEANQPGLSQLREVVANHLLPRLPGRKTLRQDVFAGLSSAMSNIPDGMANAVLVGVSPAHGLYAAVMGPTFGGIFSSTQLMMISTTAAASLATSQALANFPPEARETALFAMVMLIGVLQVLSGLLRAGQLTRFISYSVMTGFLTGVSLLLILNQLPVITGYAATGSNKITQTLNLLANLGQVDLPSVALAVLTMILAIMLPRTPLGSFGTLTAIAVPSVLVALLGIDSVAITRDVGAIPRGLPAPFIPSLSALTVDMFTGALAITAIILVQGAGVSQSVPNPDGSRRHMSRDFIAQGAANFASGFFRGLPVGGSYSATALNVIYGARSRWAVILAGLWVAAIVIIFPDPVSYIAMPALGALLILAGARGIKLSDIRFIWNLGWSPRLATITTFLATLFLPIQAAVGIGVALSALLYVNRASTDISIVQLVKRPDGRMEEHKPPRQLPGNQVTVLEVYGHLFYAGAHTLERLLPAPSDEQNPVVILRLRGRSKIGATLIEVLNNYADKLKAVNGQLYLTGISEGVHDQLVRTGKLHLRGPVHVYEATSVRGESTEDAYADAKTWLVGQSDETGAATETPQGGVR
jgi:sulfate permease, SulP family